MLTSAITLLCCICLRLLSAVEATPTNTDDEDSNWQRYLQDWSYPSSPAQHLTSHQYDSGSIHVPGMSGAHGATDENEAPASIHHNLALTHKYNQWQESPSSFGQGQTWSGPSTSSPSTPHDVVLSPQEISQADLDFLHQVMSETDDRIEPTDVLQHPVNMDMTASSASQDHQQSRGKSRKRPLPARSSIQDNKISDTTPTFRNRKALRKWPEPELLNSIPYQTRFRFDGGQTGTLSYDITKGLVGDLSLRLFAGKLHVVDNRILYYLRDVHLLKKWPIERDSRRLPMVTTTAADGTKLRIHLTLQNSTTSSRFLKGTVLQNRPYYMVFGVPEQLKANNNPIVYYGAGYLDPKDNSEVDQHFASLLARGGEEIHL